MNKRIQWDDIDNRGALLDRYEVDARLTSSDNYAQFCIGMDANCQLIGLKSDTEHGVKVRGHNSVGYGTWNNEFVFHTNAPNATVLILLQL